MAPQQYILGEQAPTDPPRTGRRRKRRWLKALIIVFGLLLLSVGSCTTLGYFAWKRGAAKKEIPANSALVLQLQGDIALASQDGMSELLALGDDRLTLDQVRRALTKVAKDDRVSEVVLIIDNLGLGFGAVETLREMVHELRAQGKEVKALIESDSASEADLYLASAASKVLMTPHTTVVFDGLAADVSFFGESLEKLGIKPEVIQFKEYKSAMEPWVSRQMSEPMKRSMQALLNSTWDNVLAGIAKDRKIEIPALQDFAKRGMGTAKQALEAGFIDEVGYRSQLVPSEGGKALSARSYLGSSVWSMGLQDAKDIDPSIPQVALIPASGTIVVDQGNAIMPGAMISGRKLAAKIRRAAKDDAIAAILLWVDSPGGSMVGSDLVAHEIRRAREAFKKPVIVSMASVAASGGYWISMDADAIVAAPSTITGSIGVIFGRMSAKDMMEKLGVHHDLVQVGGPNANLGSLWDPMTPNQRSMLEGIIGEGYAQFVQKVAQGRKRSVEEIEAVAKGRVWTGKDALDKGLVDRLGGLSTALALCREKLELAPKAQLRLRKVAPSSLWDRVLGEGDASAALGLFTSTRSRAASVFVELDKELKALREPRAWAWAPTVRIR